jgi:hypothetical protein
MVSEGVDIPRLRVGVYATPARTELFFRQVVGRFIRRTPGGGEQMSWVFLPSDPRLKQLAATVEEERRHALNPEDGGVLGEQPPELEPGPPTEREDAAFHALSSTGRLDDLLLTSQPGDQLGLFGGPPAPPAGIVAGVTSLLMVCNADPEDREALIRAGHPFFKPGSGMRIGMVLDHTTDWQEVTELVT